MPLYFLDYIDGATDQIDVAGRHFDNDEQALVAGRSLLAGRSSLEILRGGEAVFCVRVRRGSTPIFALTLSLSEDRFRLDA